MSSRGETTTAIFGGSGGLTRTAFFEPISCRPADESVLHSEIFRCLRAKGDGGWPRKAHMAGLGSGGSRRIAGRRMAGRDFAPAHFALRGDGGLNIEPVSEPQPLRGRRRALRNATMGENSPLPPNDPRGDCVEIVAGIDPGAAMQAGLRTRSTADGSQQTLIGYDRTDGTLFSETRQANRNAQAPAWGRGGNARNASLKRGDLELGDREPLRLHIFLDAPAIGTFANSRSGIIDRVYPFSPDALGIGVFARGGSATVRSLEIWDLKPISNDHLT